MQDAAEPEGQTVRAEQLGDELIEGLAVLLRGRSPIHLLNFGTLPSQVPRQALADVGAHVQVLASGY